METLSLDNLLYLLMIAIVLGLLGHVQMMVWSKVDDKKKAVWAGIRTTVFCVLSIALGATSNYYFWTQVKLAEPQLREVASNHYSRVTALWIVVASILIARIVKYVKFSPMALFKEAPGNK